MGDGVMIILGYLMVVICLAVILHCLRPKYWGATSIPPTLSSIDIVRALVKRERRSGNE
jgi:hypothetical protein